MLYANDRSMTVFTISSITSSAILTVINCNLAALGKHYLITNLFTILDNWSYAFDIVVILHRSDDAFERCYVIIHSITDRVQT